jgi:protein SCO1/2
MFRQFPTILCLIALGLMASVPAPPTALAQVAQKDLPEAAQGIGVTEQLGKQLPMNLEFEDDRNRRIRVADLFRDKRPVLLSFNYSTCPKVCVVQLQNLAGELQQIDLVPGRDFEIVSVSIDPTEQASQLAEAKAKFVAAYGKPDTADGWHFLRGSKTSIKALADACGFQYRYIPEQRIYSHPAAFIFCTSDGRISRYLDGLSGNLQQALGPALIEAGQGRIGSLADRVKYFTGCFVFDETTGKYTVSALRLMRLGGLVTVICLIAGITPYWFRKKFRGQARNQNLKPTPNHPTGEAIS